ncbi:immunity protein YezG family protein [Tepidibacter hydrothermalis]|uniref:DUF600 family protein n=1 Tax=Tepidibacter hydrothermalis TaxID=3036126 RepID=A0ABY8EDN7_9FIRM|nr:immunity protein YezG family protein [Tepidibacter hydrothermalis]WFD08955.1 DUF600 family protein [Tepidibacter hydrothermalis]
MEKQMNSLYRKIAEKVNEMIPVEWDTFYFNGEVENGEGGVYFFYNTPEEKEKYIYCYDIMELYNGDTEIYEDLEDELFDLTNQLKQVFIDNNQEPWFSITIILSSQGRLKVDFDYAKWENSEFGPTDIMKFWQKKYLKIEPKNENDRNKIKKIEQFIEESNN